MEEGDGEAGRAFDELNMLIVAYKFAIIAGIVDITFATIAGWGLSHVPMAIAVSLIGAGFAVRYSGRCWLLTAMWTIAAVWYLPFAVIIYEYYRAGSMVPLNTHVIYWGTHSGISVVGLAIAVAAQRSASRYG